MPTLTFVETLVPLIAVSPKKKVLLPRNVLVPPETVTGSLTDCGVVEVLGDFLLQPTAKMTAIIKVLNAFFIRVVLSNEPIRKARPTFPLQRSWTFVHLQCKPEFMAYSYFPNSTESSACPDLLERRE